jgi:hypothetical protein
MPVLTKAPTFEKLSAKSRRIVFELFQGLAYDRRRPRARPLSRSGHAWAEISHESLARRSL